MVLLKMSLGVKSSETNCSLVQKEVAREHCILVFFLQKEQRPCFLAGVGMWFSVSHLGSTLAPHFPGQEGV